MVRLSQFGGPSCSIKWGGIDAFVLKRNSTWFHRIHLVAQNALDHIVRNSNARNFI